MFPKALATEVEQFSAESLPPELVNLLPIYSLDASHHFLLYKLPLSRRYFYLVCFLINPPLFLL